MNALYWEDVELGTRRELGGYTFTEEEIIRFGRKYDPQVFHIDPEAAKHSIFGGLIASGWHTAAIWMKLAIESRARDSESGGVKVQRSGVSPGFEDMQWLKPVRPGMTLTYTSETFEKVELRSRPELGLIKTRNEARDEAGELVMRFTGKGFMQRRPK
ncbi:MAG TPA: MaoC family dehydratase [Rhizomicrobium sp.]|jgi:acyl dehydratase